MSSSSSLMKKTTLLLCVLGALLIAVVTYQIGSHSAGTETAQKSTQSETDAVGTKRSGIPKLATADEPAPIDLDPVELKRIFDIETAEERGPAFKEYLDQLSPENALQMLADLDALRPSAKKRWMMTDFFSKWGTLAGPIALEHAMQYEGHQGLSYQSASIEGWAHNEPSKAWKTMMDMTNNGFVWMPRLYQTVGVIARGDPALAVQLIQAIDEPYRQPHLFQPIVNTAADRGQMPELLTHIQAVEDSTKQNAYLETLFKEWGQFDNETSLAHAHSLGDPELVSAAMKGLMKGWAANDGQGALTYAIENSDDPLYKEMAVGVAEEWARFITSDDVERFADTLGRASNKDQIMDKVIFRLAMAEPDHAWQLASNATTAASRGDHRARVLGSLYKTQPERVMKHYHSIGPDAERWQSTWVATTSSIDLGESAEQTLSLLSTFENDVHRNRALDYMVHAATYADNVPNSADLRTALLVEVNGNESLSPTERERLLEKLNGVSD